jgi:hypothetical protein
MIYDSNKQQLNISDRVKFKISNRGIGGTGTGVITKITPDRISIKRDQQYCNDTHATFFTEGDIAKVSCGGWGNEWTSFVEKIGEEK